MMFIQEILNWATARGYKSMYGDPAQINDYMTDVQFSTSQDGIAVYCHLIRNAETVNWHDRADVAVYFAKLCDFDFNPTALLPVQEQLKNAGKALLYDLIHGNTVQVLTDARWQFGYNDYAENVAWCCMRVTLEDAAMDCVEDYKPVSGGRWFCIWQDGTPFDITQNLIETNGTLAEGNTQIVFTDIDNAVAVFNFNDGVDYSIDGGQTWTVGSLIDGKITIDGIPSDSIIRFSQKID